MTRIPATPEKGTPSLRPGGASALEAAGLSRALFEQSPFSTVLYDGTGRIVAVNAAFERLWGFRFEDLPATYNVLHDPQLEKQGVLPLVKRAFAGESVVTPVVRYDAAQLAGEGRSTWTEAHWYPLRDEAGTVRHVVLAHVDLTARVEAETALARRNREFEEQFEEAQSLNEELIQTNEQLHDALARAEELREDADETRHRLVHLLDTLTDVVVGYDREWRWVYLNPAARATLAALGSDPDRAIGKVVWDEVPSLRGTRFETETKRAAAENRVVEYDEYHPLLDRWFENRIVPTSDGVTTFSRDVTERRRADERLRTSEARHRVLVESSTLMVWSTDAAGAVDDMPFWRALTGQTREEVRGDGWQAAIHPADRDRVANDWRRAYGQRGLYETEYRLRLKDGTYRWFRARGVPVVQHGEVREWIGVFNEIDDERRARAAQALLESVSIALSTIVAGDEALRMLARLVVEPAHPDAEPFADGAAIALASPGRPRVVAIESVDPERRALVERLEREYPRAPDAPAGYTAVIRNGTAELRPEIDPALLDGVATAPGQAELLKRIDIYSSVIVPLRSRGETIGALSLALHGPGRRRRFDARDLAVAEELARRASTALENARRFEAEQRSAERARGLQALAAGLVNATTVREVADAIFEQAIAAVGADAGSLAVLHDTPSGREFETVHSRGYSDAVVRRFGRYPVHPGRPLSDAIVTRQPVLIGSRAEWEQRYPEMAAALGPFDYEAMALVPVTAKDRPLAGVTFSFRAPREFDEGSRTFLATLGEQCGLAMERARAFESEQRERQRSAFLAEVSRELSASLDYEATLRKLVESAVPRLGDWCAVDIVQDPEAAVWPPTLARIGMLHRDPAMMELGRELEERYPTDWSSDAGRARVLRTREPLFIPEITDAMLVAGARDAAHLDILRRFAFTSVILVPLVARGVTLGTLTLATSESRRRYDDSDLALAQDLAQRAATAVDNARLFRDAERARRDAEEANRAKSEFLATMSHELRTPLNAIDGYAQLLEMGVRGPLTTEQRADISRIRRSQKHLLSLINDVLDFARLESGRVEFDLRPHPIGTVLAELEDVIAPLVREKGLRFVHQRPPDELLVLADEDKLRQVVLNLLGNAVKFTDQGDIELSCEADARQVAIRVRDTGRGIPESMLEAVFEPFVQVDGGLRRTAQGSGLGLAIARDYARRMGGDVTVASGENLGSTFTITLPRG